MANTTKPTSLYRKNPGSNKLSDFIRNTLYSDDNLSSFLSNYTDLDTDARTKLADGISMAYDTPLSGKPLTPDTSSTGLSTTGRLLLNQIKDHPFKAAGAGILGAGNIAGLFDNQNLAGQIGGGVLGATAVPWALGKMGVGVSPYLKVMTTLGGGYLGSLFDKLMAKKAEEEQMMQSYQGQY